MELKNFEVVQFIKLDKLRVESIQSQLSLNAGKYKLSIINSKIAH